ARYGVQESLAGGESVRLPVAAARPGAARARGPRGDADPAADAGARDHGEQRDAEPRNERADAVRAEEARRAHLARRLRHGPLVAELLEALPDRHAEDRSVIRPR